jgi:hypothetical protein
MPPEHRIDLDLPPPEAPPESPPQSPSESVVEFGPAPAARRRWSVAGFGRALIADRRVVPLAAALAAVALLASLISEWQLTQVDDTLFGGEAGQRLLSTDVTDLGALGTGYLVGLFPLVVTVVLTLFGPPAGRRYCRLAGLSVGGTLLGLLLALATSLGDQSRIITRIYTLQPDGDKLVLTYGRGLWCALAGVLLALVALYLADWPRAGRPAPRQAGAPPVEEQAAIWTWRRPPEPATRRADESLELTVAPAKPFTSRHDDRDKPASS